MPISRVSANPPNLSVQQLSNPANNPLREPRAGIDPLPYQGTQLQNVQMPDQSNWKKALDWFFGSQAKIGQLPNTDPFRQNILNNLARLGYQQGTQPNEYANYLRGAIQGNQGLSSSQNLTSNFVNPALQALQNPYAGFQEGIANPAIKNFQQNTVPSLAERFTSLGEGAQRSSAFQGALGSAASSLESDLAGLRNQYGLGQKQFGLQALQAGGGYQQNRESQLQNLLGMGLTTGQNRISQLMSLLGTGLQSPFQYVTHGGQTGFLPQAANTAANLASAYFLGNPNMFQAKPTTLGSNKQGNIIKCKKIRRIKCQFQ